MMWRLTTWGLVFLIANAALGQQQPIFDPDDLVDPGQHKGQPVFISRVVIGVAKGIVNDYRPLHQDAGFLHVANNLYWSQFQFTLKYSDVHAENKNVLRRCDCNPPIYFPTPAPPNATPDAPPPAPRVSAQVAFYPGWPTDRERPPLVLRYRLSWSHQAIEPIVMSQSNERVRLSGREQSFGLSADTSLRIAGHAVDGSLVVTRTLPTGTIQDRAQTEVTYTYRFPVRSLGPVLLRMALTAGTVSDRGTTGLSVVNPLFEAFWHNHKTRVNLHLVYSPQSLRDDAAGWRTHHQIAFYADRALKIHLFPSKPGNTVPAPPDPLPTDTER